MSDPSSEDIDAPVLIIGGGPVGLGLSLELAYRNVRSILIDQGDGVVRYSKMGHVSVRSMEHCRRWGVAEAVRNCGFPHDYPLSQIFCTSLNGHLIGTIPYPSIADEPSQDVGPERKQRCPQLWFDPILARAAIAHPCVDVRYHQKLVGFREEADHVIADIEDVRSGERKALRTGYLAGCDGSGSQVRRSLGIALEGDAALSYSVGIYFTAPNLNRHHPMGQGSRYWLIGEEGTWANLTVVDAKDIWRLTIIGSQDKVEAKDFDADAWLRRCLGRDDIPYHIDAVLPWRRSRLLAQRYGEGRVFLAGDACHVNAPNGGYGMNTGIGDAVDLGWKLAAVLQGWGGPGLLATYETERRPVARRNVDAAAVNFSATRPKLSYRHVEEDSAQGHAAREVLRRDLLPGTTQEWETLGVHMGYRYEGSPLIWSDGTPEPLDHLSNYVPTARPGHRAPHFWLGEGRSVLDLFGKGFVMLHFGASPEPAAVASLSTLADAARGLGIPFASHTVTDPVAHALYERRFVLVRPDGHVAWRGDALNQDAESLLRRASGWDVEAIVDPGSVERPEVSSVLQ